MGSNPSVVALFSSSSSSIISLNEHRRLTATKPAQPAPKNCQLKIVQDAYNCSENSPLDHDFPDLTGLRPFNKRLL